jgi:tRNA(Ile)-lysidine synthase
MRGARPDAALEQTIERDGIIRRGDRVLVACSGGADSVALAAALYAVSNPMELEIALAYVHHGTRESAWQDECVVLRIGATFGLPVRVAALDVDAHDEASLRDARYDALAQLAQSLQSTVVATGHHAEDQSETVVMALLRGTGPGGLAGMRTRRPLAGEIDLARPFLRIPPEELRYYCHVHALPYAVDPTNADVALRRNALREALGALRPAFPGLDAAVARAAELIGAQTNNPSRADLRTRVREALRNEGMLRDVDFEHVEAAVRALERGGSGRFYMKPGVELRIERGRVEVVLKDE